MPYDSNGNYSLPTSYFVANGDTVLPVQHNPPFEDVAQALSSVLLRSGAAPMNGDLKMGSKKITGMADGVSLTDAVTKQQMEAADTALGALKASKSGDTFTGDVRFGPGTGGRFSKLVANGDVLLSRGSADNQGYLVWGGGNQFFGWDGTRYTFGSAGGVAITGGSLVLDTNVPITFAGTGAATTRQNLGIVPFVSAQQTITLGASASIAHGLGIVPSNVTVDLVCATAEQGVSTGDIIQYGVHTLGISGVGAVGGTFIIKTTSTVTLMFPQTQMWVLNKSTGAPAQLTPANWRAIVRAFP